MCAELTTRWPGRGPLNAAALALALAASGCATAPPPPPVNPEAAIREAKAACEAMGKVALEAPVKLDVVDRMYHVKKTLQAGKRKQAETLADALTADCQEEARTRKELAEVMEEIHNRPPQFPPWVYATFLALARSGDYDKALYCGDGILQAEPGKCARQEPDAKPRAYKPTNSIKLTEAEEAAPAVKPLRPTAPAEEPPPAPIAGAAPASQGSAEPEKDELPPDLGQERAAPRRGLLSWRQWSYVALGGGGVLLLTGAILGGAAQARYNDLDERCPDCSQAEIDGGKRLAQGADAMFALGTISAVGGAALLVYDLWFRPRQEEARAAAARVRVTGGGLTIEGRF